MFKRFKDFMHIDIFDAQGRRDHNAVVGSFREARRVAAGRRWENAGPATQEEYDDPNNQIAVGRAR